MTGWIRNDLERIGAAIHLQLETFKVDGSLRKPVTLWVVLVGDESVYPIMARSHWLLVSAYTTATRGTYFSRWGDEGCDVCRRKLR